MDTTTVSHLESGIDQALMSGEAARAETLARHYLDLAERETSPERDPGRHPWFRSRFFAARAALSAGHLDAASSWLLSIEGGLPSLAPELRRHIHLLMAEVEVRRGRHAEARERLARAHTRAAGNPADPAETKQVLCIRLRLGDVGSLTEELDDCVRALEDGGDLRCAAQLEYECGRAWLAAGDLEQAAERLRRASELNTSFPDEILRAAVPILQGRLAHLLGQYQRALDFWEEAERLSTPGSPQALESQLWRAYLQVEIGAIDRAARAFHGLMEGRRDQNFPVELRGLVRLVGALLGEGPAQDLNTESQAYQLAAQGELGRARDAYLRAVEESTGPQRRARIAVALGLTSLELRDWDAADSWLRRAREEGDALGLTEVRRRARQGLGRIAAEGRGDFDEARRWFEEAVPLGEAQAAEFSHPLNALAYLRSSLDATQQLLLGAARRGDAHRVFAYQELLRGRLLLDLWHRAARRGGPFSPPTTSELEQVDRRIDELERMGSAGAPAVRSELAELRPRRDRLREGLLSGGVRAVTAGVPRLVGLDELRSRLPSDSTYISASVVGDEIILVVVRRDSGGLVIRREGAFELVDQVEAFRGIVRTELDRYARGWPITEKGRDELNRVLEAIGRGALGRSLAETIGRGYRLIWVPDGPLHGLPLAAVRLEGRYLVESCESVVGFSGSLFVHQAAQPCRFRWRRGPALVVAGSQDGSLPFAIHEGRGVGAAFPRRRVLESRDATRRDALRRWLPRAEVLHLACHAEFSVTDPLSACVILPSGERWRADEWPNEPVGGLPLVTLSACRSAEVSPLEGHDAFGLTCGVLGGGVRAVLAGLWSVPDQEASEVIWRFYRHRMIHDLATSLALAQREVLAEPGSSPLLWALFALFGDPTALPASPRWLRWLNRWSQRRHERRCRTIVSSRDAEAHP